MFDRECVVLPRIYSYACALSALLQRPHHVVNENNVFLLAGQTLYLSFAFHLP